MSVNIDVPGPAPLDFAFEALIDTLECAIHDYKRAQTLTDFKSLKNSLRLGESLVTDSLKYLRESIELAGELTRKKN